MIDRPAPFENSTPRELWTDPHISEQMLHAHIDASTDLASHRHDSIDRCCGWMIEHFTLDASKRVADFGCGPGLWCQRLASRGASVIGIDFSSRSLEHARDQVKNLVLDITYVESDYMEWQGEGRFDLILMAMYDFCVLRPSQRHELLRKWASMLRPEGRVLFDLKSIAAFADLVEISESGNRLMGGFWAPGDYFAQHDRLLYPEEKISLERFEIKEHHRVRVFSNWMQYYNVAMIQHELERAGLKVEAYFGDLQGGEFNSNSIEFAVEACLA